MPFQKHKTKLEIGSYAAAFLGYISTAFQLWKAHGFRFEQKLNGVYGMLVWWE